MSLRFYLQTMLVLSILLSLQAFAGECEIRAGSEKISGKADKAELGDVMDILAEKTGYNIFLDKRLDEVHATFSIPDGTDADRAIRKIIKPHSYAITFVKSGESCRIRDIHIYQNGTDPGAADYCVYSRKERASSGSGSESSVSSSAKKTGGTIKRQDMVKIRPAIKKDVFGAPRLKFRQTDLGPDFRPTVRQMRSAYRRFQADKEKYRVKNRRTLRKEVRLDVENRRETQRQRRNRAIRQMLEQKGESHEQTAK